MEMLRLYELQRAFWPKAMAGDFRAAHLVLKVIDSRMRLLGLDKKDQSSDEPVVLVQPGVMSRQGEGNLEEATSAM